MLTDDGKPSAARAWYAVCVFMLAYMMSLIDRTVITLMVDPIQRDLGISDTQFSLLTGLAFSIFFSVAGLPIAQLVDRGSRRLIIAVGVTTWTIMTGACGLAQVYWQLFLARVGIGVAEATLNPAAISIIADVFPREKLARALAVFTMGGTLGIGVAYLAGGAVVAMLAEYQQLNVPLVGLVSTWKLVFVIVALPGFIVAALVCTTPNVPSWSERARGGSSVATLGAVGHFRANARAYGPFFLGFSCFNIVQFGLLSWLPALLARRYGVELGLSGVAIGIVVICFGPLGMLAGGVLADRWTRQGKWDAPLRVCALGCIGLGVFAVAMPMMKSWPAALTLLCAVFFFNNVTAGVGNAANQVLTPPHLRARATAIFSVVVNLLGITCGPLFVGLLNDYVFHDGKAIHWSMAIVSGTFSIMAVLMFMSGARAFADSARNVFLATPTTTSEQLGSQDRAAT